MIFKTKQSENVHETGLSILCLRAVQREMLSLVRGETLSVEGTDLEQLIKKHDEYRVQIDRQLSKSQDVKEEGRRLMEEGNFMSQEVRSKGLKVHSVLITSHLKSQSSSV